MTSDLTKSRQAIPQVVELLELSELNRLASEKAVSVHSPPVSGQTNDSPSGESWV